MNLFISLQGLKHCRTQIETKEINELPDDEDDNQSIGDLQNE